MSSTTFLFARLWRVSICLALLLMMASMSTTLAATTSAMKRVRVRGVAKGNARRLMSKSAGGSSRSAAATAVAETTSGEGGSKKSRSYPPPSKFQARSTTNKGKSNSDSRSEVAEEACAEAARSSGGISGKGGGKKSGSADSGTSRDAVATPTSSGGKGSGDKSRRLKGSGSKVKGSTSAGSRSEVKGAKAKKCKSGDGPDREYPPPGFMEGEAMSAAASNKSTKGGSKKSGGAKGASASGVKSGATAKAAKGASNDGTLGFVPGGEYPSDSADGLSTTGTGEATTSTSEYFGDGGGSIVSSSMENITVPCIDIGTLQAPTTQPMSTYTMTADMQVRTSQVPLADFYERLQIYFQREVSLIIAGCFGIADVTEGPITNVVFALPMPIEDAVCDNSTDIDIDDSERIGTRRAQFLTTTEYAPPATNNKLPPTGTRQGAMGEDVVTCHPTSIAVDVYHYMDLTEDQIMQVQRDLELGLTMAEENLGNLVAVDNGDVQAPPVTEIASLEASVQDDGSAKKVAFSMGVLGVILVSLVALKVAMSRRKRRGDVKRFYSDFSDEEGTAIGDNLSIDYPKEDELLGPTEGDLALEEANNRLSRSAYSSRSAYLNPYGGSQTADFILDDLNGENMSVETDPSYATHDRRGRRYRGSSRREPPPTPDFRRKGCC